MPNFCCTYLYDRSKFNTWCYFSMSAQLEPLKIVKNCCKIKFSTVVAKDFVTSTNFYEQNLFSFISAGWIFEIFRVQDTVNLYFLICNTSTLSTLFISSALIFMFFSFPGLKFSAHTWMESDLNWVVFLTWISLNF